MIRFPGECSRGGSLNSEVIEDLELKDMLLMRGPFT